MRIGIKSKLVLSFLLSNALLASLMFAISSWRFDQGFQAYVTQVEVQRMQPFVSALAEQYSAQLGWQPLLESRGQWSVMVRRYVDDDSGPAPFEGRDQAQPPLAGGAGQPPRPQAPGFFDRRYLLADFDRSVLIGPPSPASENTEWIPIDWNGDVVGFLGLVPRDILSESLDSLFVEEQKNSYAWIALGSLFIAVVIGLLLASLWLRPIRLLQHGMQKLAAGDYKQRLEVRGNDELAQLAGQFNFMAKSLEENKSVQKQWIADISHELRTPVAVLRGEIEALVDGVRPLNEQRMHSLHEEILQLQALITELHELSLSDLGALQYQMRELNFTDFMHTLMAQFSRASDEAKLTLHCVASPEPCTIKADEQKLKQMFVNLFNNTLNYTDQPGALSVSWQVEGKALKILWADSAPGVSPQERDRLFERLFRAESSRNRRTGGSGLGLAIVKNIVESHGGSIQVQDSSFGGLLFTLRLPIQ